MEPTVRNADLVTIDMASVRARSPGLKHAGPNGMTAEHLCQLSRYIGMSDRLLALGFSSTTPTWTTADAALNWWRKASGMLWKACSTKKAITQIFHRRLLALRRGPPGEAHEIVFYKSPKSDRWWMDVPVPSTGENRIPGSLLTPCSYEEYVEASNGNLPDRWWRTYQKLA